MAQSPFNYVIGQPDADSYFESVRAGRQDRLAVENDQKMNALARYLPGALQGDENARNMALQSAPVDQMAGLKATFMQMDAPKLQAVKDFRTQTAAGAYGIKDPAQWAAFQEQQRAEAQRLGLPFKEVPFEQKDSVIAMGRTVEQLINEEIERKKLALDESRTTAQNAASYASAAASRAAAGRGGMGGVRAPSGYQYVIGEDGKPSLQVIPGGPADPAMKPLTDEQAKAAGFASRLRDADSRLWRPGVSEALKSGYNTTVAEVPLFSNALVTKEYQVGDQARRDFLNAQLRRESGAVIGESEFDSGQKQYFPEYADETDVLLNKAASRKQAIYNMYVSAGPRYADEARKAKTDYDKTMAFIAKRRMAKGDAAAPAGQAQGPSIPPPPPGFEVR